MNYLYEDDLMKLLQFKKARQWNMESDDVALN